MGGDRQFYVERAYEKAFGTYDDAAWDPKLGFAANEARILKVYDYYRDTYLARPDLFLWAGLGRMAGGGVVGGLRLIGTESSLTCTMVEIGKSIFHDLAWQHEAILDDEDNALVLAAQYDNTSRACMSYRDAWVHILSGDPRRIAKGNVKLLANEQFSIIQPYYDRVLNSPESSLVRLRHKLTSASTITSFTNSIHPYHRDFLLSLPTGDVLIAKDRWAWITESGGMWEKWGEKRGVPALPIEMSKQERARLVSLPMEKIIRRDWAPVDSSLLPPGAFDI
ncbi:MAG: hypothetical protein QM778_18485 [Myxococcales bacterium]